jgi:hypothetical protein
VSRTINHRKTTSVHVHDRTYLGEQTARPLIDYLNSLPLGRSDVVGWMSDRLVMIEEDTVKEERARDILHLVQRALPRPTFRPVLSLFFDELAGRKRWRLDWEPVAKTKAKQAEALLALFELAAQGLVSRVRGCAKPGCHKWFWARFDRQRFHSKPCQERDYHTTPAWREHRRRYMQKLRDLHKKLDKRRG